MMTMPEMTPDQTAARLDRFVVAVDGIEALQLAAAAKIAAVVKAKIEGGEAPTQGELRQLAEAKKSLVDSIGAMLRERDAQECE
jgi:hypothetical protein